MFTCALYYCSIVVNTDCNWPQFTCAGLRRLTGNDEGVFLLRIRGDADNGNVAPMLQKCLRPRQFFQPFRLVALALMLRLFFLLIFRLLLFVFDVFPLIVALLVKIWKPS